MDNLVFKREDKHCRKCRHFRELGHVAHFCHAKDAVMADSLAQLCANYISTEEKEDANEVFIPSGH